MNDSKQAPLIDPLVAQILEQNSKDLAWTTNTLIDNLTVERDELQAEIKAVRAAVEVLLSGPYMPMPDAIRLALWPSAHSINRFRRSDAE